MRTRPLLTRRPRSVFSALLLALACPGCPFTTPDTDDDQAATCSVSFMLEGEREARPLEIGTLTDGAFTAFADGASIASRVGTQGATMITLAFRLPASVSDEDELCLLVKVAHEAIESPVPEELAPGTQVTIVFVRTEDGYVSEGLVYDVVGDEDVTSFTMSLAGSVVGPDFEAAATLTGVSVTGTLR